MIHYAACRTPIEGAVAVTGSGKASTGIKHLVLRAADRTHSLHIVDPNGYGVEVLYELPREVWGDNIQGAIDYAEPAPTEGDDAFIDDTNYPMFGTAEKAAE